MKKEEGCVPFLYVPHLQGQWFDSYSSVFFFVSFILLTNFYRSSKIDGPYVYVCLYETFEDNVFTKHFSLP